MNNRGFVSVAMLVLLPLLGGILALVVAAYQVLLTDGKIRHQCRMQLLQSQEKTNQLLKKLMDLNPEAKRLRKWVKRMNKAKSVTPGIFKVVPYGGLAYYLGKQAVLATQQKSLIAQARFESETGPMRASRFIRTVMPNGTKFVSSRRSAKFDVVASPQMSLTPDYYPSPQFSQAQIMEVKWEISLESLLPDWLGKFLDLEAIKLRGSCSATLEQKGKTWQPVLSAAKP